MMRLLISGGPGSGCTTTARLVGERLGLPVFDSDSFFHKPTDPPFQEQYTLKERRMNVQAALSAVPGWILSGSVATWGVAGLSSTHGIFLDTPTPLRLERLQHRQRTQFGSRIDPGGDMHEEHESFLEWAAGYEERTDSGRNRTTDRAFLETTCLHFLELPGALPLEAIVSNAIHFVSKE